MEFVITIVNILITLVKCVNHIDKHLYLHFCPCGGRLVGVLGVWKTLTNILGQQQSKILRCHWTI